MSLVSEVKSIVQNSKGLSHQAKAQSLREIIEHYRNNKKYEKHSLLDKVCKGKTTFQKELEKTGLYKILNYMDRALYGTEYSGTAKNIILLDETIKRLYSTGEDKK